MKDQAPRRRARPGAVFWVGWLVGTAIATLIACFVAAHEVESCRIGAGGGETDTCPIAYMLVPLVFVLALVLCGAVAYVIDRSLRGARRGVGGRR